MLTFLSMLAKRSHDNNGITTLMSQTIGKYNDVKYFYIIIFVLKDIKNNKCKYIF